METITFDSVYSVYEKGSEIEDRKHLLTLVYQTLYRMNKGSGIVDVEKGVVEMDIMGKKHSPVLLYSYMDNIRDIALLTYLFYRMKKGDKTFRFLFSYDKIDERSFSDIFVKTINVKYGDPFLLKEDVLQFMPNNVDEVVDWVLRL